MAGGHRYLQLIEGPANSVNALMDRIRRDQRHVGVTALVNRRIGKRAFASWSMAYFEEPRLGDYETLRQMIDRVRAEVSLPHLREQIDCFERLYAVGEPAPAPSPWTLASSYAPRLALDGGH